MTICPGTIDAYWPFMTDLELHVLNPIYCTITLFIGVVAIAFTAYICLKKKRGERPVFVMAWIIFVHFYWICESVFYIFFVFRNWYPIFWQTLITTTGASALSMCDWLLIEQFLYAALMMPSLINAVYAPGNQALIQA